VKHSVFIIDDDSGVRASIQELLKTVNLRSEGFATPQGFLRTELPDAANCLILDVRLPGVSGLDFQKQLTAARGEIPIIFITGHCDIPMTARAMEIWRRGVSDETVLPSGAA